MIDTIEFVYQVGYSEKEMYDLVKADPRLLFQGSGKKLYLLLGRLIKSGVDVNVELRVGKDDDPLELISLASKSEQKRAT
ncbi:hypothetical protein L195_g039829 [Trifolium pratense]|uniref:Uncharacterized protein n=1 Tax=Trifolium pratense TaxID=57577 RepID=A0A2K3LZ22_TRIPR|nr:hypothetical protein L195_g039829 [Trifolium pratense]